ncbi:putative ribonuclease H protein [Senna tora]|uniref:Putative ribonuclease H protein n=1 Tax=Senna tora TaxID=362788 RepID=A0A834WVA0_9FABA|nr:putative ribonuclease H protein [Senna tora]
MRQAALANNASFSGNICLNHMPPSCRLLHSLFHEIITGGMLHMKNGNDTNNSFDEGGPSRLGKQFRFPTRKSLLKARHFPKLSKKVTYLSASRPISLKEEKQVISVHQVVDRRGTSGNPDALNAFVVLPAVGMNQSVISLFTLTLMEEVSSSEKRAYHMSDILLNSVPAVLEEHGRHPIRAWGFASLHLKERRFNFHFGEWLGEMSDMFLAQFGSAREPDELLTNFFIDLIPTGHQNLLCANGTGEWSEVRTGRTSTHESWNCWIQAVLTKLLSKRSHTKASPCLPLVQVNQFPEEPWFVLDIQSQSFPHTPTVPAQDFHGDFGGCCGTTSPKPLKQDSKSSVTSAISGPDLWGLQGQSEIHRSNSAPFPDELLNQIQFKSRGAYLLSYQLIMVPRNDKAVQRGGMIVARTIFNCMLLRFKVSYGFCRFQLPIWRVKDQSPASHALHHSSFQRTIVNGSCSAGFSYFKSAPNRKALLLWSGIDFLPYFFNFCFSGVMLKWV